MYCCTPSTLRRPFLSILPVTQIVHLAEEVVHLLEDGLLSEVQYELALLGQANGEALEEKGLLMICEIIIAYNVEGKITKF